jgi:hypothetical protein
VLSASRWKFPENTQLSYASRLVTTAKHARHALKDKTHLIMLTYVNQLPLSAMYSRIPRFESWLGHLYSAIGFNAVSLNYLYVIKQLTRRSKARYLYTTGTRMQTTPSAKQQPHRLYSDIIFGSPNIIKSSLNCCRSTRRRCY